MRRAWRWLERRFLALVASVYPAKFVSGGLDPFGLINTAKTLSVNSEALIHLWVALSLAGGWLHPIV